MLVGHSLAGEEMSYIGSRHPEAIAGLIYLDAGYSYAYYTPDVGDPIIDAMDLDQRLSGFLARGFEMKKTLRRSSALLRNWIRISKFWRNSAP